MDRKIRRQVRFRFVAQCALVLLLISSIALIVWLDERTRATEAQLIASGEYEGRSFAEDSINGRFVTPRTKPRRDKLKSFVDKPALVRLSTRDVLVVDFGTAAFAALRIVRRSGTGSPTRFRVRVGEQIGRDGRVWRYRPSYGPADARVVSLNFEIGDPPIGRAIVYGGPRRVRPQAPDLPAGLDAVLPFRYVEIEGHGASELAVDRIRVQYPFSERSAKFASSDPALNRVWDLSVRTIQRTSFAGLYVDGQRERKPYEADAYINQLGHYSLDSDYRMGRDTLDFLLENPNPISEWALYPVFMAHTDYMYSGDRAFLLQVYARLKRALPRPPSGTALLAPADFTHGTMADIIDWPVSERDNFDVERVAARDYVQLTLRSLLYRLVADYAGAVGRPRARLSFLEAATANSDARYRIAAENTVVNSLYYGALWRMSQLAMEVGRPADARAFQSQAQRIRRLMIDRLFDTDRKLFVDAPGSRHSSMHANAFALAMDLVPPADRLHVARFVASRGLRGSPYAAQLQLEGLFATGAGRAAIDMMVSSGPRGWIAMIDRSGSTLTTEAWSSQIKPNQDWSHAWSTAPVNVTARWLVGIRPVQPGFRRFIVAPQPGNVRTIGYSMPTTLGTISVAVDNTQAALLLRVAVPQGALADIQLPDVPSSAGYCHVEIDSREVSLAPLVGSNNLRGIGPGIHEVSAARRDSRTGRCGRL